MHGYHDAGSDKGYLIPRDGLYDDPIYESWVAHSQLADIAASIPCRRVLVSLDACYSGIFSANRDKPGVAAWETGNDCQARAKAAFAGKDQTRKYVAAGGDQRVPAKSGFAVQWHRALQQGYGDDGLLSFAELAATLDQFKEPRPVWGDFVRSTLGDFVFVRKDGCATPPPPDTKQAASPAELDKALWRQAQATNTIAAYRKYLRDCSLCLYSQEAETAILQTKPVVPINSPSSTEQPKQARPDDGLIRVPGGTFTMGCTAEQGSECSSDENPAHQVRLKDFYIGKYEVTQALWRNVMGNDSPNLHFKGCDQCPVETVSWEEVQVFLKKLNAQTSRQYRLPTEAEWEYAARGGALSKGYKYAGSNSIDDVAWYSSNAGSNTHAVGGKKANELGLFDMSGNVWEWCGDWFGTYPVGANSNPLGPSTGSYRVFRGGSWSYDPQYARVVSRYGLGASFRRHALGFRLARTD